MFQEDPILSLMTWTGATRLSCGPILLGREIKNAINASFQWVMGHYFGHPKTKKILDVQHMSLQISTATNVCSHKFKIEQEWQKQCYLYLPWSSSAHWLIVPQAMATWKPRDPGISWGFKTVCGIMETPKHRKKKSEWWFSIYLYGGRYIDQIYSVSHVNLHWYQAIAWHTPFFISIFAQISSCPHCLNLGGTLARCGK